MVRIHPTAEVDKATNIGNGTTIWHQCQVRSGAIIGENCILGRGVYIDSGVVIGSNVKIQNYVSIYHGVTIEDGVFVGPHVCFTNDLHPRAVNPDGTIKAADDWILSQTLVRHGASLGANSTVVCGTTIGEWAIIGAGSVVSRDVDNHALVFGNPARLHGFVCPCGYELLDGEMNSPFFNANCKKCGRTTPIPIRLWEMVK